MKLLCFFSVLSLILISCDNSKKAGRPKNFNAFDFSYNDFFTTCFSIKFTQGDSVFIRQHFAPAFLDTIKSNKSYFAILSDMERQRLDSFLNKMRFISDDTSYYESYEDGDYYQFYIDKDSIQRTIFVHSYSAPIELKDFGYWIVATKKS